MLSTGVVQFSDAIDDPGRPWAATAIDVPLCALVGDIASCDTVEALRLWAGRFARACGVEAVGYFHFGHCRPGQRAGIKPLRMIATRADSRDLALLAETAIASAPFAFLPVAWDDAGVTVPIQDHAAGLACLALTGASAATCRALVDDETPALIAAALALHVRAKALMPKGDVFGEALSDREIECLRLAAHGQGLSAIAATLGISVRTVEIHVGRAARKLSALNKVHAVAIAVGAGLIAV